jgi:sugar phosphate isomerase/epimerase
MRLGIFAKTFPGSDALTVLSAAKRAGFETVQFNTACLGLPSLPTAIPAGAAGALRDAMAQTGVSIAAISATWNMIHPDPAIRAGGLAALDLIAGLAAAIDAPLVTLCTGTRDPHDQWKHHPDNDAPEAWRDLLVALASAIAIAERHGVVLGIEPESANVVSDARKAAWLLRELSSERLAIVLDPANLTEGLEPDDQRRVVAEAVEHLGPAIAMAHAKDRDAAGQVVAAGTGVIDFAHFGRALRGIDFRGPLITHGLAPQEAPAVAAVLAQSFDLRP